MAYTRREMLGKALLAGAGASVLGPTFESAVAATFADDAEKPDPHFLGGQVASLRSSGALTVMDADGRSRGARLSAESQTWKRGTWGADELEPGDCVYATGALGSDGVFGIDRVWVAIETFGARLRGVDASRLILDRDGRQVEARIIDQTEVRRGVQRLSNPSKAFRSGDVIDVVGFYERETGAFTASRIWLSDAKASAAPGHDELHPVVGEPIESPDETLVLCPYTWRGLATFFCCGNVSGCGYSCGSSGQGYCYPSQTCRSYNHQMAWQYVWQSGANPCQASCQSCCSSVFDIVECGTVGHLWNPCQSLSDNATIVDCGPNMRCTSAFGCLSRSTIMFDLTPCAFAAIGGSFSSGMVTCDTTVYLVCP